MKKLLAAALAVLSTAAHAQTVDPARLERAKAEGKVAYYANITANDPILKAFGADTGIKAEYTRISTTKFVATAITEFQAGRFMADVVQGPLPVLEILKDKGMLAKYSSKATAAYPDWTRKDGIIQLFGIEYIAVIYNKERISAAEAPKRYEDLADPKWRDKIVMPNPSNHATTIAWLRGLRQHVFKSDADWMKFLHGLAANRPLFVASLGPTPAPIESGERPIGISMPKYIVTKAPAPLDWARIEQPMMGTPRAIAISAKAPHPNAARAFMDYWLSSKAMGLLAKDVGEYVMAPGVYPPIDGIDKAKVIAIEELSDEETRKWGAEFKKIFDAK
jgi:iron(III) transport system substrate-binding protein